MNLSESPHPPKVSVLVANHNYEEFIGEAIQSVLDQRFADLEIIVCDDGSTDGSRQVIEAIVRTDSRIRVVSQANRGQAGALNTAFRESSGEFIALLDADDRWYPDKLERVVPLLGSHGFVLHPMDLIDAHGRVLLDAIHLDIAVSADDVRTRGGRWRSAPTSSLCFTREAGQSVFPIPETSFRAEADGFIYTG